MTATPTTQEVARAERILERQRTGLRGARLKALTEPQREALEVLRVTTDVCWPYRTHGVRWDGLFLAIRDFAKGVYLPNELGRARPLLEELAKYPGLAPMRSKDGLAVATGPQLWYWAIEADAVALYNVLLGYVMALEAKNDREQRKGDA